VYRPTDRRTDRHTRGQIDQSHNLLQFTSFHWRRWIFKYDFKYWRIYFRFRTQMLKYNFEPHRLSSAMLLLIRTRRLGFFKHVARTGDSQDTFRALLYVRRSAGSSRTWSAAQVAHVTPSYGLWKLSFSRSTTDSTRREDSQKTDNIGGSSWRRLRSSLGHALDDDYNYFKYLHS